MKNLNQFSIRELNSTEAKAINGGGFWKGFREAIITITIGDINWWKRFG